MTPKSLLRHKRAVSRLDEMGPDTTFHRILWDDAQILPDEKIKLVPDDKIRRVVMCSGKVYYDLYEEREKRGIDDIYLLRVEQLYPVPLKALVQELTRFNKAQFVWCQEEPRNMGAYSFIEPYLEWVLHQSVQRATARLCRAAGLRCHGDRADVTASQAAPLPGRRGARPANVAGTSEATCGRLVGIERMSLRSSGLRMNTRQRMDKMTEDMLLMLRPSAVICRAQSRGLRHG